MRLVELLFFLLGISKLLSRARDTLKGRFLGSLPPVSQLGLCARHMLVIQKLSWAAELKLPRSFVVCSVRTL